MKRITSFQFQQLPGGYLICRSTSTEESFNIKEEHFFEYPENNTREEIVRKFEEMLLRCQQDECVDIYIMEGGKDSPNYNQVMTARLSDNGAVYMVYDDSQPGCPLVPYQFEFEKVLTGCIIFDGIKVAIGDKFYNNRFDRKNDRQSIVTGFNKVTDLNTGELVRYEIVASNNLTDTFKNVFIATAYTINHNRVI
jgi:hypothetical protein